MKHLQLNEGEIKRIASPLIPALSPLRGEGGRRARSANRSSFAAFAAIVFLLALLATTIGVRAQAPEFEFIQLPQRFTGSDTVPNDINDVGQAIGTDYSGVLTSHGTARAVAWSLDGTPTISTLLNLPSWGTALNNLGNYAGVVSDAGLSLDTNFITLAGITTLIGPNGFTRSSAMDLNDSDMATWTIAIDNATFYRSPSANNFGAPYISFSGVGRFNAEVRDERPGGVGYFGRRLLFINNANDIVGVYAADGIQLLVVETNTTARVLYPLPGYFHRPSGVNNRGDVAVTMHPIASSSPLAYIYNYRTGRLTNLYDRFQASGLMSNYVTRGINDANELVGSAYDASGQQRAILYSGGSVYDLRVYVPAAANFVVREARAINNAGDIVGWGQSDSSRFRPFLLRRATVPVGTPIAAPPSAQNPANQNRVYRTPTVEAVDGTSPGELATAYVWSDLEQRFNFFRPITVKISWWTSANLIDTTAFIPQIIRFGWPTTPQIHVGTAPVQLDGASTGWRAVGVKYSTVSGQPGYSYDSLSKTLVVPPPTGAAPVYNTIHYALAPGVAAGGLVANPTLYSNYVQVVRTVAWNDPAYLQDNQPATVGTKVTDPRGQNPTKSGFTIFTNAPYDGVGADAAYVRTTQTGPIIPVNIPLAGVDSNLVVAFYQPNPTTGALWADKPVRFAINWPASQQIVIANTNGLAISGATFQIYQQPNASLPGYNPNEEHAFIVGNSRLYALRNDLNRANTSASFVLLKFRDPGTSEWRINPYQVILSDGTYSFRYHGEVGKELQLPPQMTLVNRAGCSTTPAGPVFTDYLGRLYGRSGPTPDDPSAEAVLTMSYRVQQLNFFIPAGAGRTHDTTLTCTTWRGVPAGGSIATDIPVTFRIHWPGTPPPVLAIGETLLGAKHGLPGVENWARADVVFDSLDPSGTMPLSAVARLYDPVSVRHLVLTNVVSGGARISSAYQFPPEITLETAANGQRTFTGLPYYLRSRLTYDPGNKWLNFAGALDESVVGEPFLLNNVLTPLERDRILQLSGQQQFQDIIGALYDLTRNPNRVDADRNGQPDPALLVGYTTNAAGGVVREQLGSGPKALAAARSLPTGNLFGRAVQLDGTGYVQVPSDATLNAYPLTVTAWIRTTDSSAAVHGVVNKYLDASGNGYSLHLAGGNVRAWFFSGGGASILGGGGLNGGSVADGQWHHVAFTVEASGGRLYVDGAPRDSFGWSGAPGAPTSTEPLRVGRYPGQNNFTGDLDEVAVWNVARTPAQIADAMNAPLSGLETGLAGYWRFDETNGPTARDAATGFRDGAWNGGVTSVPSGVGTTRLPLGSTLALDGGGYVQVPHAAALDSFPLTLAAWVRTTNTDAIVRGVVNKYLDASANGYSLHMNNGQVYAWFYRDGTSWVTPGGLGLNGGNIADGQWHHVAFTVEAGGGKLYVDGTLKQSQPWTGAAGAPTTTEPLRIGRYPDTGNFIGQIDEVALWNVARTGDQVHADAQTALAGSTSGLAGYWRFEEASGANALDSTPAARAGAFTGTGVTRSGSGVTVGNGIDAPRYLVLTENNAAPLSPVNFHIIRVGGGPFVGDLKVILPDNVFDERLTLRHSADFGGDPSGLEFEWYYHPDDSPSVRTTLPLVNASNGGITDFRGWQSFPLTTTSDGATTVTLGDTSQSSLVLLGDNWFICRYRGYSIGGTTRWSDWVGGPGVGSGAQLAPGWVKRVVEGLNPFEQRTTNFHAAAVNTYSSMLIQAGRRYEGDIAFNPGAGNLNSLGLIEAYTTVLRRARKLSIDGTPAVEFAPANNAMLLAASRISDLYMLLGNEGYADASDPTIGYDTSGVYGNAAPSIFAFQNQLDSLLEEELTLLRGRDSSSASVTAPPVYNHLFWNFTHSDGEVAYAQVYNISDQPGTSPGIDEFDARVLYPQGHGDAWGHYLTAITTYYDLLRHPRFTWIPRAEATLIAGAPVTVDYLDERKFAKAAAAKARTGAQLVDLTYRNEYVEDPNGQYQGYKDTDADRAWGVSEWARRAGQGAFFDWVTANAILPATDPVHTGIQKVDRTTVAELDEIIGQHNEVQAQLDKADGGLNPLGVAAGAVPFDINPAQVIAATPLTHYEQISQRALTAVNNTLAIFNYANQLSQALRRNQDSQSQLQSNTTDKERDLKNRMIEIFGYPYAGDIGAGGTYPSGYDGPDFYHYMYVGATDLTGEPGVPQTSLVGFYSGLQINGAVTPVNSVSAFIDDVPDATVLAVPVGGTFQVTYPFSSGDYGLVAPAAWGSRRAPGKLQANLSDMLRAEAKLKQSVVKYDLLLNQIQDTVNVLGAQYNLNTDKIIVKTTELGTLGTLAAARIAAKAVSLNAKRAANLVLATGEAVVEGIPKSVGLSTDAFAPLRSGVKFASLTAKESFNVLGDQADFAEFALDKSGDIVKNSTGLALEVENQKYEVIQKVVALQQLVRTEVQQRYELYELKESLNQAVGNYQATLAQGLRIAEERIAFRRGLAATTQQARYNDMAFRIFQNDAIQKYRAQFDLAARYVYLAAKAYDYETCLLGSDTRGGQRFLTDIIRQRSLGQIIGGVPVSGSVGLTDPLARLDANFGVLKGQLGFTTPETETGRFSLRTEHFRIGSSTNSNPNWREALSRRRVADLWAVPEFRKYCRSFAPDNGVAQPGLVIELNTTVTSGLNYFAHALGGGDSFYDSSRFATKVRSAGVWFTGYNSAGLSTTPRVYLVPAGDDILRVPTGGAAAIRTFSVVDQKLPVPFAIGNVASLGKGWIPANDTLDEGGDFGGIRQFSQFRAYHDSGGFSTSEATQDTRLIGRSVWNTRWLLIIPGASFLADPNAGLDTFIHSVSDIKIFFQTYAYSGG